MSCCVLAFTRHPIYGLVAYVAVFYMNPATSWWGYALPDLRWAFLAAGIALLALVLNQGKLRSATPLRYGKLLTGLLLFMGWLAIQSLWALDPPMQTELITMYAKYALVVILIYKCADSEDHLRLLLWAHVVGCAYLGWTAYGSYEGGRFEGFGGGGIGEANAGALQLATGLFVAASLFLSGTLRERVGLLVCTPFIANALVTTISRSGFLALAFGALVFNLFTPPRFRAPVRWLSMLAVVLFAMLTNATYWTRISSIGYVGEDIQGVDTGSGRLQIVHAQIDMFLDHPLGCGHRCTITLSPQYLEAKYLTGPGEEQGRASHNTFFSLLVEQGVPGALFFLALVYAVLRSLRVLARQFAGQEGRLAALFPAAAAVMTAIMVGDMFVDHLKAEVRIWFLAILVVMAHLSRVASAQGVSGGASASPRGPPDVPRATALRCLRVVHEHCRATRRMFSILWTLERADPAAR
jgi:O-antigen ligase